MRLEIADHDVYARSSQVLSFFEHLVCLSDTGGIAHEDLQFPAPLSSHLLLRENAHVYTAAFPYQLIERPAFESRKSRALTVSNEKLRDPPASGEFKQRFRRVVTFQNFHVRAGRVRNRHSCCLLYTSDAADD